MTVTPPSSRNGDPPSDFDHFEDRLMRAMNDAVDDERPPVFDGDRIYRRTRRRRNALVLAVAAATVVITAGTTVGLTVGGEDSPGPVPTGAAATRPVDNSAASVPVPPVTGLTWSEAQKVLDAVGLEADFGPKPWTSGPATPPYGGKAAVPPLPGGDMWKPPVGPPGKDDKVFGSRPALGVPVPAGGTVTLMIYPGKS